MEIPRELEADAGVPGLVVVGPGRAVGERNIGEIEDQAAAVRAADIAVVEGADANGRAIDVIAGAIKVAVAGAGDVKVAEAETVRVIPDKAGVGFEAVERVAEVRRSAEPIGGVQFLPLHDVGELDRDAVQVAVILVLAVEADVEIIV